MEVSTLQGIQNEHPNNNMQHLVKFMFSIVEPNGSSFLPKAIESTFMTPQPASHPL
jgi:hypothetical protein